MKLRSISIVNFRQFWKEVKLEFSLDNKKNITVVHGANGSGKTSLLNAFKWCFYNKTDFDTNDSNLLNESAIKNSEIGEHIRMSVTVIFEDEGKIFEVKRQESFIKRGHNVVENLNLSEFVVESPNSNGESIKSPTPESDMNAVLPETLQPYFFFNGERIEKIAGVNESSQIREAIKRLMGLKQLERAQRHLDKVSKKFRRDSGKGQGIEVENQIARLDEIESSIQSKINIVSEETENIKNFSDSLDSISSEIKSYESVLVEENRKAELNTRNDAIDAELVELFTKRKLLIEENRAVILSDNIVQRCAKLVAENRKKGILPYTVRATFIEDLIDRNTCICGRDLDVSSRECLSSKMEDAGSDSQDDIYSSINYFIKDQPFKRQAYIDNLKELTSKTTELHREKKKNSEEISEISVRLLSSKEANVAELESRRNELEKKLEDSKFNLRTAENDLPLLNSKKEKESKLLDSLQQEESNQNLALERKQVSDNLSRALGDLYNIFTEKVRVDLSQRVGETFNSIIRKNMRAYIDEEFHLKVDKGTLTSSIEAKEQSTGEKQVTSLSFIASLISLAKERHGSNNKMFKGGLYPLVMDSPFGALDEDYRFKVARKVSELADQVVIFVSNSQWQGDVKEACEGKVGSCYKLVHYSNSATAQSNQHSDFLRFSESDDEYSIIEKVNVL